MVGVKHSNGVDNMFLGYFRMEKPPVTLYMYIHHTTASYVHMCGYKSSGLGG